MLCREHPRPDTPIHTLREYALHRSLPKRLRSTTHNSGRISRREGQAGALGSELMRAIYVNRNNGELTGGVPKHELKNASVVHCT
jgi:hypothetical protein